MVDTLFPPNRQTLAEGVIGPVIQRTGLPPLHLFVRDDNRPPASELAKENAIEQRRKQGRLHQAQYRIRQREKMASLEGDIQQLQRDLQRLHAQRHILVVGVSVSKTIWHVAAEYFRLFRNGYRAALFSASCTGGANTQRDFCMATMTTDVVADDTGYGVNTILQHWKDLSFMFEGIGIQLVRLEHCAEGGVLASVRSVATLSDKTISCAFPHLIRDGEMSLVAAKLQGQRIEMRGWVHFQWSDEVERVESVRYNVDILTPIMKLLHDLEDTARVFNNANITPESKLVSN